MYSEIVTACKRFASYPYRKLGPPQTVRTPARCAKGVQKTLFLSGTADVRSVNGG